MTMHSNAFEREPRRPSHLSRRAVVSLSLAGLAALAAIPACYRHETPTSAEIATVSLPPSPVTADGVSVVPASTLAEKQDHAMMCSRQLHLSFPAVADGMDGAVENAYSAWPSRAFVVGIDGRIRYSTHLTELDFHAQEMESVLRNLTRP